MALANPDPSDLNVSGVRIYNYYPLRLENKLFMKTGPYSSAAICKTIVNVLGFNETSKNLLIENLKSSGQFLAASIYENKTYNYVHFQFAANPEMDFFMLPYVLISTEEVCNSSTWISSADLISRRWSFLGHSDYRVIHYFGGDYTIDPHWLRGGWTTEAFSVVTSVENVSPSVHAHFYANGAIVDPKFCDLLFTAPGMSPTVVTAGISELDLGIQFDDLPHLVLRRTSLTHHDIALISYNDNPRVTAVENYRNPIFPLGHATIFSNFIWQVDSLLRYAYNQTLRVKQAIGEEFAEIDSVVGNLQPTNLTALQQQLNILAARIKSDLADFQSQLFDLQDLTAYCESTTRAYTNSTYFSPFASKFQEQTRLLEEETTLSFSRYAALKDDYDAALEIVSQLLANANAQAAIFQAWQQLLISVNTAVHIGLASIVVAILATMCPYSISYWSKRKWRAQTLLSQKVSAAELLSSSTTLARLRSRANNLSIETHGLTKLGIALRIVEREGIASTVEPLETCSS